MWPMWTGDWNRKFVWLDSREKTKKKFREIFLILINLNKIQQDVLDTFRHERSAFELSFELYFSN